MPSTATPARPLTAAEDAVLNDLARTGLTLGALAARSPSRAREIRAAAARARRALRARTYDEAIQIHRTRPQASTTEPNGTPVHAAPPAPARCCSCRTRLPARGPARYVCADCETTARLALAALPSLYVQLDDHLVPARTAGEYVRGSAAVDAPLPAHPTALTLRAAGGILSTLESWVSEWREMRFDPPRRPSPARAETRVALAAAYLDAYLAWAVHHHPAVDEVLSDIHALWTDATGVTAPPDPATRPRPAGRCPKPVEAGRCRGLLTYQPGGDLIWCDRCSSAWGPLTWLALRGAQVAADRTGPRP